ncbi:MAG: N-acetylmuramoyl-L-alanine amidase [Phycisphaerae bacterium]|nr:N-acetylmuramoyl-L-alanine amidase [Phycisphaerae bacterium]
MNRKVGSIAAGLVCAVVAGLGCSTGQTSISELDPYVGGRPEPVRRLPPPPPRQRHIAQVCPQGDWIPPCGVAERWDSVVIHHSGDDASTPQGMRDWHVNGRGWEALGYHFVIGNGTGYPDGEVYVGERWIKQMHGAHCKTASNEYNQHGIGICLIGNLNHHSPTPKQIQSLARLLSFLSGKCGISKSRILTHGGITHKTECPGRYFSLGPVLRRMSSQPIAVSSE